MRVAGEEITGERKYRGISSAECKTIINVNDVFGDVEFFCRKLKKTSLHTV